MPYVGGADEPVEEETVAPVQSSRLPLQVTQQAPPSKPDTNNTTSYQHNKRNSSVSSESGNIKKPAKTSETNKPQRIQDISNDSENRALLTKSPSAKSLDRGAVSNIPKKESSEHSVSTARASSTRKTRASTLKPPGGGVTTPTTSPRKGRREEGWKEVGRRYIYNYALHVVEFIVQFLNCNVPIVVSGVRLQLSY